MNKKVILVFVILATICFIATCVFVYDKFLKQKDEFICPNEIEIYNNRVGIPVLMYHSIKDNSKDIYQINLEKFRQQMQYLKDNQYKTLSIDEYEKNLNENCYSINQVLLTFDDGHEDFYTNVYPILKEFGYKATIFISYGYLNEPGYLTEVQLKEIAQCGFIDIGGHGKKHERTRDLSQEQIEKIISNSNSYIKEITGKNPTIYAHPYGEFSQKVIDVLKGQNVKFAFSSEPGFSSNRDDLYVLRRIFINSEYDMKKFVRILTRN